MTIIVGAALLTGCASSEDAGDQSSGSEPDTTAQGSGEAEAGAPDGCTDVLADADIDGADGQQNVRAAMADLAVADALAAVPALAPIGSSLETLADDVIDPESGFTLFAPSSAEADDADDDDSRTEYSADEIIGAHVIADEIVDAESLLEAESVGLADGSTLEVAQGDYVTVSRDGIDARVICPDIEVDGGVVHIVDAYLFDPADDEEGADDDASVEDSDDQVPGTEPSQPGEDGIRPDLREELDERSPSDGGGL